jgi:hypothetical protein
VVLISSLLIVGVLFVTSSNSRSPYGTIHVKNEKELLNAINKATVHLTIKIDNDIILTKPLTIPNNKNITLTSNTTNTDKIFYKLSGATDQTTITINRGGILHFAGITVTHKLSSIYGDYIEHENGLGVNIRTCVTITCNYGLELHDLSTKNSCTLFSHSSLLREVNFT